MSANGRDSGDLGKVVSAIEGLVALVRAEYPPAYSIGEIAATWGEDLTVAQKVALDELGRTGSASVFVSRWMHDLVAELPSDAPESEQ